MTYGRIINGIKYITLHHNNKYKKKSLEDNVYFTLRDIFTNAEDIYSVFTANNFNSRLSNGIHFEDRTNSFQYTNILQNKEYLSNLIEYLNQFAEHSFEFIELDKYDYKNGKIHMDDYMKWDDWWSQFINLIKLLDNQNKLL